MDRVPPTIDMLPDGTFRTVRPGIGRGGPSGIPFSAKLLTGAVLVGGLAICLAVAALAAWVLSMLLPVLVIAAGVAWVTLKWRRWQGRNMAAGNDGRGPVWNASWMGRRDRS